jgi:hypothetical protein
MWRSSSSRQERATKPVARSFYPELLPVRPPRGMLVACRPRCSTSPMASCGNGNPSLSGPSAYASPMVRRLRSEFPTPHSTAKWLGGWGGRRGCDPGAGTRVGPARGSNSTPAGQAPPPDAGPITKLPADGAAALGDECPLSLVVRGQCARAQVAQPKPSGSRSCAVVLPEEGQYMRRIPRSRGGSRRVPRMGVLVPRRAAAPALLLNIPFWTKESTPDGFIGRAGRRRAPEQNPAAVVY